MKYELPKINKPKNGRRIAIGDIHGCSNTLKALIKKLALKKDDQIYLLGDLIDKGENSKAVIDFTMQLKAEGLNLYLVRGNHEQSFLTAYSCGFEFFLQYLADNNTEDFLDGDLEKYLQYFDKFEYGYDLGDWLVCHAEFLVKEQSLYRGMKGLFSKVDFQIKETEILEKRQVTGHAAKTVAEIKWGIEAKDRVLFLDSGCIYKGNEGLGYLSAFDLDSFELITQENIENAN